MSTCGLWLDVLILIASCGEAFWLMLHGEMSADWVGVCVDHMSNHRYVVLEELCTSAVPLLQREVSHGDGAVTSGWRRYIGMEPLHRDGAVTSGWSRSWPPNRPRESSYLREGEGEGEDEGGGGGEGEGDR